MPTCGYFPLNLSVHSFVLTRGAAGLRRFPAVAGEVTRQRFWPRKPATVVISFVEIHLLRSVRGRAIDPADLVDQPQLLRLRREEDSAAGNLVDVGNLVAAH